MAKTLGDKVRELREIRGMSGVELARQVGINASYVSEIENGNRVPSIDVLKKIANSLRADPGYFISERAVNPKDIDGVPLEFLKYLLDENKIEFLKIAKELDEKNLPPETIRRYIKAIDIIAKSDNK